ncbi:hypothetical protein DFH27DRAFT_223754 [Peziza echinospora]|nr:hypothetical protein DFH27DRAFT_223754 [Peziza echinospora]
MAQWNIVCISSLSAETSPHTSVSVSGVTCLSSLQATFVKSSLWTSPSAVLKFERGQQTTFFRDLQSPVVSLIVGTPGIVFSVREDAICKLPFFHAALHGGFCEAASKTIRMPEDDPPIIAALMEYLLTGRYTYAYDNPEPLPTGDVKQALFHLNLYAAAKKYDCGALVKAAVEIFSGILEKLDGPAMLVLLKAAYVGGMSISELFPAGIKNLKKQMVGVYKSQPEVMTELIDEFPDLVGDLFRLLVMGDYN